MPRQPIIQLEPSPAYRWDVEETVSSIRQSSSMQLERLQAYVDGAVLAVEQVQDIRINLTERALEATASDAFLSAVMTALLESTIAGRLLTSITGKLIRPILRTNIVFQLSPSQRSNVRSRSTIAAFIRSLRENRSLNTQQVRELVALEGASVNTLRRYAAALSRGSPEMAQNLVAGAKALYAYVDRAGTRDEIPLQLAPSDTAGVGILSAAHAFAANQRVMASFHATHLEAIVRAGAMTSEEMAFIASIVRPESLEDDLHSIRNRYKLLFEAVIWAKLYGFDRQNVQRLLPSARGFRGVPQDLLDYWFLRLARSVEEWSRNRPRGVNPVREGQFSQLALTQRVSHINQYLSRIGASIPADEAVFRSQSVQ